MDLPAPLAWLMDEAGAAPGLDRFLAELGGRLLADGLPLGRDHPPRAALCRSARLPRPVRGDGTRGDVGALDAWFDRVAGAVHASGDEVLKFIGDGVLAIFLVTGAPAEVWRQPGAPLPPPVPAWPISMLSGRGRGCRRFPSARRQSAD